MSDHTIKRTRGADVGVEGPSTQAGAAITPGELLDFDGSGDLIPHGVAGGTAQKIIALEDANREAAAGTKQIDTDYPVGDDVKHIFARRGGVFYMFLADGQSVSKGDALESDGAGALQAFGTAADAGNHDNVVGYAEEAVTASGARARILVRIA